ncbi:hypothetical protein EDC94DRAFT_590156 [Helicostylum pulchrum]|nr:hypothetical protein EDC94DRAFT_590156 [Helicostylum pulchrum]
MCVYTAASKAFDFKRLGSNHAVLQNGGTNHGAAGTTIEKVWSAKAFFRGLELATVCVLSRRDNRLHQETIVVLLKHNLLQHLYFKKRKCHVNVTFLTNVYMFLVELLAVLHRDLLFLWCHKSKKDAR